MATLGFGRPSFRSLFASGPSKSTVAVNPVHHDTQGNVDVNEQPRSTRSRQTGLRENTEDSSILPDIGENLQNIAVSTRGNIHAQNIGTDSQSISAHDGDMYSDSLHNYSDRSRASIEAIEFDLRLAQEEVERIKAAQKAVENNAIPQLEPMTSPTAKRPTVRSTTVRRPRTQIPQPQQPSAAARLQARHEENERQAREVASKPPVVEQPPPPSAGEFPALGNTTPSRQQTRNAPSSSSRGRRASYANISAGSKRAGSRAAISTIPSNSTPTRHPARSAATTSVASPGPLASPIHEGDPGEDSIIFSPIGFHAGVSRNTIRGPSSPIRQPPRFAQPTKAFTIRTSESQRKDSVLPENKSSPETSPNKTLRTLAQRHQKRSSLPGAWISSPASATSDASVAVGSLGVAISPSRYGNTSPVANEGKGKARADAGTENQTVRSYMSPTKATAQRELATLGQENVKQAAPRMQKQLPPINSNIAVWAQPPSDVYSESASVSARTASSHSEYIITERPESPPPSAAVSAFLDRTTRLLSQARRSHNTSMSSSLSSAASIHPPSRRSTIGITTMAEVLSVVAKETGLPPNNYIKRRGSNGHLLDPITEKLNRLGLLDRSKSGNVPDNAFRPLTSAAPGVDTAGENMPKTSYKPSGSTTQEDYGATSPHLRRARAGTTGDSSQPNLSSAVPAAGQISSSGISSMLGGQLGSSSQPRSLRATAQEFRPMAQSTPTQPQRTYPAQRRHAYISDAVWRSSSPEVKKGIFFGRHFGRNNRNLPVNSHDSAQHNLPFSFDQIDTDGSFSGQVPAHLGSFEQSSGAEAVSEPTPQAGHFLQPEVNQNTNRLCGVVRDGTVNSYPINLGRAAAPSSCSPGTPMLSPRSDDTSPRRSPPSPPRGWSIASAASMRGNYGWAGGDGREIKFRGYGPDAERDPNNPVNFSVQSRAGSYGVVGPRMIGGGEDDENWSPPLAPRSRRQWAEIMGYSRIPCDHVEITSACETSVPLDPQGWGFCWDCDP